MLDHTPGLNTATFTAQEILIGRALGRALAHELGHFFFRSKIHSLAGLMRSARPANEFFGLRRDGFQLTPEQQATAVGLLLRGTGSWSDPAGE
jgi:hypothetical protein